VIVTLHDKSKERPHFGEVFLLFTIYSFAAIGALFVSVFFANRFKITNVSGSVDILSNSFQKNYANTAQVLGEQSSTSKTATSGAEIDPIGIDKEIAELNIKKQQLVSYLCSLKVITPHAPKNVLKIIDVKRDTSTPLPAVTNMIFAIKTHLDNPDKIDKDIASCVATYQSSTISEEGLRLEAAGIPKKNIFVWPDSPEWPTLVSGITKDQTLISEAAKIAQIDPRHIVSCLVVEQLRLYYSQRELYKKFFEPLKILANANKFSLGVMSIKEETAAKIEKNLKDRESPFYLGPDFEKILDYPSSINIKNIGNERYNRLTAQNHYYNYLYGALYLKQFITQWQKAGYDIAHRPEIVGTLFNLGFSSSNPNPDPQVGGSNISIAGTNYSFGRLASEFYYSGEIVNLFPYRD